MRLVIALFFLVMLTACGNEAAEGDISSIDPNFFNLKDFVAQEQARLESTSITKTVSVNDIEETQEISKVDWELELAPFAQSNIDRPAFWDSYNVDSSVTCEGKRIDRYMAIDTSTFTKLIEVMWSDQALPLDSVFALSITNGLDSYIASTAQRLIYWNGGYEIRSTQKAILSEQRNLSIKSSWAGKEIDSCVEAMLK